MMSHMLVIGWLALLISACTTADLVVDLVFEEPDMTADAQATTEEPDNAAEHLLMPSQRAGGSATDTVMASQAVDLDAFSTAGHVPVNTALRAVPPHHRPPRSRPVSFSVPLRI